MHTLFRDSRYSVFFKGSLCAFTSIPFLIWGLYIVTLGKDYTDMLLPFVGILLSLSVGVYSMFHQKRLN